MDIFTTQIAQTTKAVTAPIKKDKLKVKALAKDARLGKLKQGVHELDDSEYDLYEAKKNQQENLSQESDDDLVELSEQGKALEHQENLLTEKNQATENTQLAENANVHKIANLNSTKKKITKILKHNSNLDVFI